MKFVHWPILIILLITISGCGSVRFDDVSHIKQYSELVGMEVVSKEELILHGWTEEDFTVEKPVFYSFSMPPGTSNRFVKSRVTTPVGLKLKIIAVVECNNCFLDFEPRLKFIVAPEQLETKHKLPIYLDDSFLIKDWGNKVESITYDYSVFAAGS